MSRLDDNILRLKAQRACLNLAAGLIGSLDGPVFELGLGNGRTYDHLREILPEREIFVFDREMAAHPACVPDPEHLFLGEFSATVPAALARFSGRVALLHADIGSADRDADRAKAVMLAALLPRLLAPGGLALSDRDIAFQGALAVPLPAEVAPRRYFIYRAPAP